jgi:hypothetical protein
MVNARMQMGSDTDYFPLLLKLDLMEVLKPGATTLPGCAKSRGPRRDKRLRPLSSGAVRFRGEPSGFV